MYFFCNSAKDDSKRDCCVVCVLVCTVNRLTIVVREADTEVDLLDLLLKKILLVEEEYNGCGGKEPVIADTVEQVQTFVHTVLWRGRTKKADELH